MLRALTIGALMTLLAGCFTYPCDNDVLECEEGEAFEVDRSCEAQAPLELEIVEMSTMMPLDAQVWPEVHHGPQGGIHFDLGVRLTGLEPGHAAARLTFEAAECMDESCDETALIAQRTLYADESLLEAAEDASERAAGEESAPQVVPGIVLLLEHEPGVAGVLRLDALDPCGREASLEHVVGVD